MPLIALLVAIIAIAGGVIYISQPSPVPTPTQNLVPATTENTPAQNDNAPLQNETPIATATITPAVREETPVKSEESAVSAPIDTPVEPPTTDRAVAAAINGTFEGRSTYRTPARGEHAVLVTVTVTNNLVTAISTRYDDKDSGFTNGHQERFDAAYKSQVIGRSLNDISLSRVGGASLTTNAFNEAIKVVVSQI